jgi:uracil-DNA glycosylase family 4
MDARRLQYLDAMGIQAWELRASVPARDEVRGARDAEPGDEVPAQLETRNSKPATPNEVAALDWTALQQRVSACTLCEELAATRTQTVFGVGDHQAQWLVIGEAPGADEDAQGEPFVGRAGQLLNAMLLAIGLKREQVFIANVLKCRPPGNRDPKTEEAANCEPYLRRQIALLQPRMILAVGRIAAQNLLKTDTPIGKLRGQVHRYGEVPLVVTYHPAYLLRSPGEKRKAWDDLRLAANTLQQGRGT